MENSKLTSSQKRTLSCILESKSTEEAAHKAKVSRSTIYNYLKDETFKKELHEGRDALFSIGLDFLKQATGKAAKELLNLLESGDENTRRLTAKEILGFSLKIAEIRDLEIRISRVEDIIKEENKAKKR